MRLLEITEIVLFLEEEFKEVDKDLVSGLFLKPIKRTGEKLASIISKVEEYKLGADFKEVVTQYDLDEFTLANIQFGVGGCYMDRLSELNNKDNYWYKDCVSAGVVVVGLGDPYTVLLSIDDGVIYVVSVETSFENKLKIADTFSFLIRGLGTAFYARRKGREEEFLVLAKEYFGENSLTFWEEIVY
ncbi:hypothetical protein AV926_05495 [Myroides marinus]|uniref:Uncharacterized protein n=1 Tax=Myroides marinus TaxID=703342 RepID=A0A161SBA5_9FLAO|nr:hypothetical protein [Myroides marinus]KZE82999.1 hypothetical protein AV926_05495 [Myroides marinus]